MSRQALLWIDHREGSLIDLEGEPLAVRTIRVHEHPTSQHHSEVRSEHEMFARVADALAAHGKVLIVGPRTGLADFRHYLEKHRPRSLQRVAGWQPMGRVTDPQLAATGRRFFALEVRTGG